MSADDHAYAVNPIVSDSVLHNARVRQNRGRAELSLIWPFGLGLILPCPQTLIRDMPTDLIQHPLSHISTSRRRCWRLVSRINKWLPLLPSRHNAGLALDLPWARPTKPRKIFWCQLRHKTQSSPRTGQARSRRWRTRTKLGLPLGGRDRRHRHRQHHGLCHGLDVAV